MKFRLRTVWLTESKDILRKYQTLKEFSIETVGDNLYITLKGFEDLIKLSKRYGELIISASNVCCDNEDSIEIYDSYRE